MNSLYLVYWGNGCAGAFSGKDLRQIFNGTEVELGMRLGQVWATGKFSEIKIVTPSDLQELRKQRGMEWLPFFSDYPEGQKPKSLMKVLWLRTGMSVLITDEEEKAIFDENIDGPTISAIFRNAIMEGRASLDGDSYIPFSSIEQFNRAYSTHYKEDEFGFSL